MWRLCGGCGVTRSSLRELCVNIIAPVVEELLQIHLRGHRIGVTVAHGYTGATTHVNNPLGGPAAQNTGKKGIGKALVQVDVRTVGTERIRELLSVQAVRVGIGHNGDHLWVE